MELNVVKRTALGKGAVKKLRQSGHVPAVVYKGGEAAEALAVAVKDMEQALQSGEKLFQLTCDGATKETVIKEVQFDELRDLILHVDFNEIALDKAIMIEVELVTKGIPVGVKDDHGILEQQIHRVEVECLPTQIPENITIDVSELRIGDSIQIKNLVVPEGVKVQGDGEIVLTSVAPPKREEEEAPAEVAEGEEAPAEPEVITAKKEEAEDEAEKKAEDT